MSPSLSLGWSLALPRCPRPAVAALLLLAAFPAGAGEAPPPADPARQEPRAPAGEPITTLKNELGDLLRQWAAEGTAAGHDGDFYDNRDRGHSEFSRSAWPRLRKIEYTKEQKEKNLDWAFCAGLHPGVVFGNSSTSAPAYQGGSNPRQAYVNPRGLAVLLAQYTRNHLYVYPEHQDHDPGHNGVPDGWGDLYPTNTPFVLISQGSSGSDQPFLRAIAATLAAFRPEVKKKLAETGFLMPVVQMVFRASNKHLADPAEYRTGKAHPTVFEGKWVDDLAMAKRAHAITLADLPPAAVLKVVEEDAPVDGLDFCEPGATEKHFDSPFVVARVFRGRHAAHRMVVSAEGSVDANQRPLTYHWAVLRGDASRIRIVPKNDAKSAVELVVPWHDRRPVAEGSPLESNRVDIGLFVNNGKYDSPPAFVTIHFLDHEARTHDEAGRLLEIGYSTGETRLAVADGDALFALLRDDAASWPARLLRERFTADELAALRRAAEARPPLARAVAEAESKKREADAARGKAADALKAAEEKAKGAKAEAEKGAAEAKAAAEQAEAVRAAAAETLKASEKEVKSAQKALDAAQKALKEFFTKKPDGLPASVESLVIDRALGGLARDPEFYVTHQAAIDAFLASPEGRDRQGALEAGRKRPVSLGLLKGGAPGPYALTLLRAGAAPAADRATRYEKAMLERFHGEVLANVLFRGAVRCEFRVNYVPPELSEPPAWRDVYRYDGKGNDAGWTRYVPNGDPPADFTADGLVVLERDAKGRPTKARTVTYKPEEPKSKPALPHWRPTLQIPGSEIRHYAYEGDDAKGRVTKTERVGENK